MKKSLLHRSLPITFIRLSTFSSIPGLQSQEPWGPISIWEKTGANSKTCPCGVFNHLSRRMRVSTYVVTFPKHTRAHLHVHKHPTTALSSSTSGSPMPVAATPPCHFHWNPPGHAGPLSPSLLCPVSCQVLSLQTLQCLSNTSTFLHPLTLKYIRYLLYLFWDIPH